MYQSGQESLLQSLLQYFGCEQVEDTDPVTQAWQSAVLHPKTESTAVRFMLNRTVSRLVSVIKSQFFQSELGEAVCLQSRELMLEAIQVSSTPLLEENMRTAVISSFTRYVQGGLECAETVLTLDGDALHAYQNLKSGYQTVIGGINQVKPLTSGLSPSVVALFITPFSLFLGCLYQTMQLKRAETPSSHSNAVINAIRDLVHKAYLCSCTAGMLLSSGSTLMMLSSAIAYASDALLLCQSSLGLGAVSAIAIEHLEIAAVAVFFAGYSVLAISTGAAVVSLFAYAALNAFDSSKLDIGLPNASDDVDIDTTLGGYLSRMVPD